MLLVVAVVGGAIFSVAQSEGPDSVSGFSGGDVLVDDFGITQDDELGLNVRSGGTDITVSKGNVSDPDTGEWVFKEFTESSRITVGDQRVFQIPNVTRTTGSNTLDVEITYDSGGLENLQQTGTISGEIGLTDSGNEFVGGPDDHSTGNGELSEPSDEAPSDLEQVHDGMDGSGEEGDPYVITNDHELQAVNHDLDAYYELGNDIDASGTENWNGGEGFVPIGDLPQGVRAEEYFTGNFNGNSYEILDLTADRNENAVGLFGATDTDSTVQNLGIVDGELAGENTVGGLKQNLLTSNLIFLLELCAYGLFNKEFCSGIMKNYLSINQQRC